MLNLKGKIKRIVVVLYQKRESSFFKQANQARIKHASPLMKYFNVVLKVYALLGEKKYKNIFSANLSQV